jgi:hypothetical protein
MHLFYDILVCEIFNPLTVLCVYTGSQASHNGLASSKLPSSGNSPTISIVTPGFPAVKVENKYSKTDCRILKSLSLVTNFHSYFGGI